MGNERQLYRDIKRLAYKLERFIDNDTIKQLKLNDKELDIITTTRLLYSTNKEMQQDELCKYMFDLSTKALKKMERQVQQFIQELKA